MSKGIKVIERTRMSLQFLLQDGRMNERIQGPLLVMQLELVMVSKKDKRKNTNCEIEIQKKEIYTEKKGRKKYKL